MSELEPLIQISVLSTSANEPAYLRAKRSAKGALSEDTEHEDTRQNFLRGSTYLAHRDKVQSGAIWW